MRKHYPSDLSDAQWRKVQTFFERSTAAGGRLRKHEAREL